MAGGTAQGDSPYILQNYLSTAGWLRHSWVAFLCSYLLRRNPHYVNENERTTTMYFQQLYRTKPLFLFLIIAYIFSACSRVVLDTSARYHCVWVCTGIIRSDNQSIGRGHVMEVSPEEMKAARLSGFTGPGSQAGGLSFRSSVLRAPCWGAGWWSSFLPCHVAQGTDLFDPGLKSPPGQTGWGGQHALPMQASISVSLRN